jgi:predicted nuclease of predicted toxin-antitoxin system
MVEPVALLLNGHGHRVIRARDAGLADETDSVIMEFAFFADLVIVTFDPDFRSSARRKGARCLFIRTPERSARQRLAEHFGAVIDLFAGGALLVTLPAGGPPSS